MQDKPQTDTHKHILLAFYGDEKRAEQSLRKAVEADFPLDRISILGKAHASGDDPLGVYYPSTGDRMKGWGKMGAFWGGLWGLLSGAAGMFLIPGFGPLIAAGPVVEALVGALGGAGLAGGAMAGAAVVSKLGVAVHRMGVPEQDLHEVQSMLEQGHYLLLLIVNRQQEREHWLDELAKTSPERLLDYPYVSLAEGLREAI
jgi:hypothetical protein